MTEEANIKLYPLAGWDTATIPGGSLFVALTYVEAETRPTTAEELAKAVRVLRYSMTADQAEQLAMALQQAADKARERQSAEGLRH